jgi:hypothetical protein
MFSSMFSSMDGFYFAEPGNYGQELIKQGRHHPGGSLWIMDTADRDHEKSRAWRDDITRLCEKSHEVQERARRTLEEVRQKAEALRQTLEQTRRRPG